MLATAKSLYVQVGRTVPKQFTRLMWTVAGLNQIFVLPVLVGRTATNGGQNWGDPEANRQAGG